jgi:hypothetical protein
MAIPKKNQAEEEQSPESQLSERYPDPAVEVLDPSLAKYRIFNAAVEHLASGMRWSEGPSLVRWRPISVVERPSQQSNYDSQGSLH